MRNHHLKPFSSIFDTPGNSKMFMLLLLQLQSSLSLFFLYREGRKSDLVYLSFNSISWLTLLIKIHFKSAKQWLAMRNYILNPFSSFSKTPGNSKILLVKSSFMLLLYMAKLVFFSAYFHDIRPKQSKSLIFSQNFNFSKFFESQRIHIH